MADRVAKSPHSTNNQSLNDDKEPEATSSPQKISDKSTPKQGLMTRKKKRRNSIVEIGSGPSRVKIYTINRKNGYREFTLYLKEGGRFRRRSISCMDEARMVAQQISVKIAKDHMKWFATFASVKINDVTVAEISRFLYGLTMLGHDVLRPLWSGSKSMAAPHECFDGRLPPRMGRGL
jgi:hypothetical protein